MQYQQTEVNPSMLLISRIFGLLASIGGLTHGIGEMLQGNTPTGAMWFNSWNRGPIFDSMGGDPALSIVQNYLITGILTFIVSLITLVWAAANMRRKHAGRILILLAVIMLLVGGGVGSPVICLWAGAAGTAIYGELPKWRKLLDGSFGHGLARSWPLVFSVCLANSLFLFVIGMIIINFRTYPSEIFSNSFLFGALSFPVMIVTGLARDIQNDPV